jgi:hypothetical protein
MAKDKEHAKAAAASGNSANGERKSRLWNKTGFLFSVNCAQLKMGLKTRERGKEDEIEERGTYPRGRLSFLLFFNQRQNQPQPLGR